jgi:hypothetical protein
VGLASDILREGEAAEEMTGPNSGVEVPEILGLMRGAESLSLERVSKVTPRRFEELPADQGAANRQERLVDVGSPLVAHDEATETMEPGQRAFDDPATDAEAAAVRGATSGQDRDDP